VNANDGFYAIGGTEFHPVTFPTNSESRPMVDQLLGVNNAGIAVGFWINANGHSRGYEFNISTQQFTRVLMPGKPTGSPLEPNLVPAAINNKGDVAGFLPPLTAGGRTDGFLKLANGTFTTLAVPGATMTQAFGVNDAGEVVGAYTTGTGKTEKMHGFTWQAGRGFTTVDDPQGVGTTANNGVNNAGVLVGFYTDAKGNTDGLIAQPGR
jgi:probable HAF family extracellular repeat protein